MAGDRTGLALPHRAVVDFPDRSDLGGGSRQEQLIGVVEIPPGDRSLPDVVTFVLQQVHQRVAGDPIEDAGRHRRGGDGAVADEEQILSAPLGDGAVGVQHDRLVVAGADRLRLSEDAVQVAPGALGVGYQHAVVDAAPRRHPHPDAVAQPLFAQIGAPAPGGDGGVDGGSGRVETDRSQTVEDDGTDVGRLQLVDRHDLLGGLAEVVDAPLERDAVGLGGTAQSLHVVAETEDGGALLGLVGTDPLEDAGPVMEGMGQHVHVGLRPRDHLAVHPDVAGTFHEAISWQVGALKR